MPRANLTVTLPEDLWIGDVSRAHQDTDIEILAVMPDEDGGVGLAEVDGANAEAVVAAVSESDAVETLEVVQQFEDRWLVQFETTLPLLLLPIQGSGVPLELPFTIRDGTAEWDVTASRQRLSDLASQLEEFEIPYTVNEVRQHLEPEQLLTDRQLRLVSRAVELGYYDTPRECTLTELADAVGVAKSTCSETLHRAEETIVKEFTEDIDVTPLAAQ